MDLKNISRRIAALADRAPRPRRLCPGLIVQFVDCIDGKPAPVPNVPHRQPEARDPARGLDVILLDTDGLEIAWGAQ